MSAFPLLLPDGTLLKGGGPEIYLFTGGARRWVPDPPTLLCVGSWQAVVTLPDSFVSAIPRGPDLPSRANGSLLKASGPKVFVVEGCRRRWVPDPDTLNTLGGWAGVRGVSDADLASIPEWFPLPSAVASLPLPASDTTPPRAAMDAWFQSGRPMVTVADIVGPATVSVPRNDFVLLSALGEDNDGGCKDIQIWTSTTVWQGGSVSGPGLASAPDAKNPDPTTAAGQIVSKRRNAFLGLDVAQRIGVGGTRVRVDVWAKAVNFSGGNAKTPVLRIQAPP
jgi:hypothetical protein